jgi:DNA-binding beta-propeller fold protein YncE
MVVAALAAVAALHAGSASQVRSATARYHAVANWATLAPGTTWGVMSWVDVDRQGNIYVFQRSDPSAKVMVFDAGGRYVRSWGEDMFAYPHALRVLRDGHIWTTDRQLQQIFCFDTDGRLLVTIGRRGLKGDDSSRDRFNGVSDVVMADDGTLFVSDGEGGNHRIVQLTREGRFIKSWGSAGDGPGELDGPHCVTLDAQGRVYVCDRANRRIQVFDRQGAFVAEMKQFGTPASIVITDEGLMYVAAGAPENKVTIGTTDGAVLQTIDGLDSPHGIGVGPDGSLYVAQSSGKAVLKYARR